MKYVNSIWISMILSSMVYDGKSLHELEIIVIFVLWVAFLGLEMHLDGWLKRHAALYNQEVRRLHGVNDFDEVWTV